MTKFLNFAWVCDLKCFLMLACKPFTTLIFCLYLYFWTSISLLKDFWKCRKLSKIYQHSTKILNVRNVLGLNITCLRNAAVVHLAVVAPNLTLERSYQAFYPTSYWLINSIPFLLTLLFLPGTNTEWQAAGRESTNERVKRIRNKPIDLSCICKNFQCSK